MIVLDDFPISFTCGRCGGSPTTPAARDFAMRAGHVFVIVCSECQFPTMLSPALSGMW